MRLATLDEAPMERYGDLADVFRAVAGLSVECKRVLTLRKVYGWEHDRIASHLGIETQTVRNDLSVCIQSIARYYERS